MNRYSVLFSTVCALLVGCAHQARRTEAGKDIGITTPKLEILNDQVQANPENAQDYSNRGYTLAVLGEKERARADLKKAVTLKDTGPMHNGAGWSYFNLEDYEQALREWKIAAEMSKGKAH